MLEQTKDVAEETTSTVDGDVGAEAPMDEAAGPAEIQSALPLDLQTESYHSDDLGGTANGVQHEGRHEDGGSALLGVDHHANGTASTATPAHRLQARFLGARELLYKGQIVWPIPGVPDEAAMELLVFLGVEDPAGVRADLLSDSLWEEDDEDDGDRSYRLRKRRYRLRRALKRLIPGWQGDPIARMDKQTPIYRLDPTVIQSDVHRFLRLLNDGRSLPREGAYGRTNRR